MDGILYLPWMAVRIALGNSKQMNNAIILDTHNDLVYCPSTSVS